MIKNVGNQPQQITTGNSRENIPREVMEFAENMEADFANFLFKEMGKSVARETPENSSEEFYNSLLTSERAQMAAKDQGTLGIKKAILDQIYPSQTRKPFFTKNDINNIKGEQQDSSTLQEIKDEQ